MEETPTLIETATRAVEGRVLLKYEEAGKILGCSASKARKLVAADELEATGEGRGRRVTAASLLAHVARMKTSAYRPARAADAP